MYKNKILHLIVKNHTNKSVLRNKIIMPKTAISNIIGYSMLFLNG